jgi:hypothetical protein
MGPYALRSRALVCRLDCGRGASAHFTKSGKATVDDATKRRHRRYPISAPVRFDWVAPNGAMGLGIGTTRDISERGAFVFARKLPPVGAVVNLWIGFRGTMATSRARRLEVSGKVVRGEVHWDRAQPCGFAVSGKTRVLNATPKEKDSLAASGAFERV